MGKQLVSDSDYSMDTNIVDKFKTGNNIETAAGLLRQVSLNWFAFVILLQSKFACEEQSSAVDTLMTEFASQLPKLGFSEGEVMLIEQSRLAYLETIQQSERIVDAISLSSTDSSSDETEEESQVLLEDKARIKTKLPRIKEKARKRVLRESEQRRFLRKEISKSTKTIVDKYSAIGDVIEKIVQESDAGADR